MSVDVRAHLLANNDRASNALRLAENSTLPGEWVEWLFDWASHLRLVENRSVNTVANYVQWAVHWLKRLHGTALAPHGVDSTEVINWQRDLAMDGTAPQTRALALTALRRFYNWHGLQGRPGNPAAEVKGPKRAKRQPVKFSTRELQRLLGSPDQEKDKGVRDFAMLLFFYATGARREEVASLELHKIVLRTRSGAVKLKGKNNKERTMTIEGPVVDALLQWLAIRKKYAAAGEQRVFVSVTGSTKGQGIGVNGINAMMNRHLKNANIKKHDARFGVHRLRSTFATDMYDAGNDLPTIQMLLGHEEIETTMQYIAITDRHLQKRLPTARMNEVLGKIKGVPAYANQKR